MVILGIDAHKRTHTVVAVDSNGRRLAARTFGTATADHLALLRWAEQLGPERGWAVEGLRAPVPAARAGIARRRRTGHPGAGETDGPCP